MSQIQNRILFITAIDPATGGYYDTDVFSYKKQMEVYMPSFNPSCTEDDIITAVKNAAKPNYVPKLVAMGFTDEQAEAQFETVFEKEITEDPNAVVETPVGGGE